MTLFGFIRRSWEIPMRDSTGRAVHCWKDRRQHVEDVFGYGSKEYWETFCDPAGTCFLLEGHEGPHVWTDDDKISVSFEPACDPAEPDQAGKRGGTR